MEPSHPWQSGPSHQFFVFVPSFISYSRSFWFAGPTVAKRPVAAILLGSHSPPDHETHGTEGDFAQIHPSMATKFDLLRFGRGRQSWALCLTRLSNPVHSLVASARQEFDGGQMSGRDIEPSLNSNAYGRRLTWIGSRNDSAQHIGSSRSMSGIVTEEEECARSDCPICAVQESRPRVRENAITTTLCPQGWPTSGP